MIPFAVAATEYGALAGRGSLGSFASGVVDALSSPDLETVAWVAAVVAVVLLATRRSGRLAFMLLLACAAIFAIEALDLW